MRRTQSGYFLGLCVALASGCAAMAHEVLWTRRMIDLIGATSESTARVIGCFFFGLALGAALSTQLVKRTLRPWRAVGLVELGVGLLSFPALTLPAWSDAIWPMLGPEKLTSWPGSLTKLALSLFVVLPPSVLMGMALPLIGRAVLSTECRLGRQGVWLYATNSAGGVLGLILTVAFSLDLLGISGSMLAAISVNVLIAAACLVIDRTRTDSGSAQPDKVKASSAGELRAREVATPVVLFCAFASGFGVLGTEMLAFHMFAHVVPSALPATAAVLATAILTLAVAAGVTPSLVRRLGPPQRLLPTVMVLTAIATASAPIFFVGATDGVRVLGTSRSEIGFLLKVVGHVFVVLGPGLLLGGLVFPLTMACQDPEDPGGRRWGKILAVNGVGGLMGIEMAQGLLMPGLGMYAGLGVIGLGYALVGLILHGLRGEKPRRAWSLLAAAAATLVVAGMIPGWLLDLPYLGAEYRHLRVIRRYFGPEGSVLVAEDSENLRSLVTSGQYVLGTEGAHLLEQRQAHLPLLIHPDPRRVAFIGLATGITAGATLAHNKVESITAIELWPQVVDAAAESFGRTNGNICTDPRTNIVVEDGRTYIAATLDEFDVVVGDYFRPWRTGVGRLHSLEHYHSVKKALRPGGLFVQWLPLWEMGRDQVDIILATFVQVFPRVYIFQPALTPWRPAIAILGFRQGDLDWNGLRARCERLHTGGAVKDPPMLDPEGIAMLYIGSLTAPDVAGIPVNTLGNALFELSAGRMRITGPWQERSVTFERWFEFQRDYGAKRQLDTARSSTELPVEAMADIGQLLSRVRMARYRKDDASARELLDQLGTAIRETLLPGSRDLPGSLQYSLRQTGVWPAKH